eukprot:432481-Pleurochrysis_carterae.AAC.1
MKILSRKGEAGEKLVLAMGRRANGGGSSVAEAQAGKSAERRRRANVRGDWPYASHGNDGCGARQKQRGDVLRQFGGGNPSGGEAAVNVV